MTSDFEALERWAPDLLPPQEAALLMGLSHVRIHQLLDDGVLRGIRVAGGRRLITRESVEKELTRRASQPPRSGPKAAA